MTQADELVVDCAVLEEAARRAYAIAQEAVAALGQVREAVAAAVAGAPGSRTAEVAQQRLPVWERWLQRQVDVVETVARRLEETAADYCATDQEIGSGLEPGGGIPGVPGGGHIGPHMDPPGLGEPGSGADTGIPGVPGGGHIGPHSQYGD